MTVSPATTPSPLFIFREQETFSDSPLNKVGSRELTLGDTAVTAEDAVHVVPTGGHVGRYIRDDRFSTSSAAGLPNDARAAVDQLRATTSYGLGDVYVDMRDGVDTAVHYRGAGGRHFTTTSPDAVPAPVADAMRAAREAIAALRPHMTPVS